MMYAYREPYPNELMHFGIEGMKWGVRRFQNPDGSLTEEGRIRYGKAVPMSEQSTRTKIARTTAAVSTLGLARPITKIMANHKNESATVLSVASGIGSVIYAGALAAAGAVSLPVAAAVGAISIGAGICNSILATEIAESTYQQLYLKKGESSELEKKAKEVVEENLKKIKES